MSANLAFLIAECCKKVGFDCSIWSSSPSLYELKVDTGREVLSINTSNAAKFMELLQSIAN